MSDDQRFPDQNDVERARELVELLEDVYERMAEGPGDQPLGADIRRAGALARAQRDVLQEAAGGVDGGVSAEKLVEPLADALRRLCVDFRPASECKIDFRLCGRPTLEGESAQVAYGVTRNLLEAFIERGEADRVTVSLGEEDDVTILTVSDEGTGFNPATVGPGQLELRQLRDRVDSVGGHVGWEASWEGGTRIEVHI